MSITEEKLNQRDASDRSRRAVFMVAGLVALLIIGGLIVYLKTRPEPKPASGPANQTLENGLRAGSAEFEKHRELIKLDEPEAVSQGNVAGGLEMVLATTVRNFTGRTLSGVEMKGTVTDLEDKPIKERTMIVIPSAGLTELENNKTARVKITIPGFTKQEDKDRIESGQAKIKMEVTAVSFK
jgi:hypothetical protein